MVEELDRVELMVDLPKYGLKAGERGAVMFVVEPHDDEPGGAVVEFYKLWHTHHYGLADVRFEQIRVVESSKNLPSDSATTGARATS